MTRYDTKKLFNAFLFNIKHMLRYQALNSFVSLDYFTFYVIFNAFSFRFWQLTVFLLFFSSFYYFKKLYFLSSPIMCHC